MNPIELVQQKYDQLTKTERIIGNAIINDPKGFCRTTPQVISERLKVSKAALIRFCKKLGYSGYNEYIYELRRFLMTGPTNADSTGNIIQVVSDAYIQAFIDLRDNLDEKKIKKLSRMIVQSQKVRVFGFNRSGLSALQLASRSLSVNIDMEATANDASHMLDVIRISSPKDLLIFITVADTGGYFIRWLPTLIENRIPYAIITMKSNPELFKHSKINFVLPSQFKAYGTFYDEQMIFFLFIEILIHEMGQLKEKN